MKGTKATASASKPNTTNKEKTVTVSKTEDEKSLRGTVSLFKNEKTGMSVYVRGKKVFLRSHTGVATKQVDTITAGYTVRREYAESLDRGEKVFIHPKLVKCKWGAEASLKLERMIK